ncbi:MAG TPA: hypothetical protein VFK23_01595, partial [Nitrospirota bacterium]|nr:hypothetical protein [Nitrospirota bacterium]
METINLKKMMKRMESALAATSFAEEGEPEAARSILKEDRRVLLALKKGQIDAKTLKYALNTAKRISAHLDILFVSTTGRGESKLDPLLEHFVTELRAEKIQYRLIPRTGCLKQQIVDYTNSEKDILFAVIESPHSLD